MRSMTKLWIEKRTKISSLRNMQEKKSFKILTALISFRRFSIQITPLKTIMIRLQLQIRTIVLFPQNPRCSIPIQVSCNLLRDLRHSVMIGGITLLLLHSLNSRQLARTLFPKSKHITIQRQLRSLKIIKTCLLLREKVRKKLIISTKGVQHFVIVLSKRLVSTIISMSLMEVLRFHSSTQGYPMSSLSLSQMLNRKALKDQAK